MFSRCEELVAEYDELERRLADPALHVDQVEARRVGKRHALLRPTVETYREWLRQGKTEAARELSAEDPAFAAEAAALAVAREATAERLAEPARPARPAR